MAAPLAPEVAATRAEVLAARMALQAALDDLSAATRETLDVRTHIRRHPLKASAIAGGAAFLVLGGPRRVIRSVTRRIGRKRERYDGLLPDEVRRILRDAGTPREEELERALEVDFAEYLRARGRVERKPRPNAVTSLWRTYDALVGPLGALAARMAERIASGERADEHRASGPGPAGAGEPARGGNRRGGPA